MTEPSAGFPDRLDSWKAIADHLGRDVRTVRRWEQKLGLPVRRVPGGRGHSVFAYVAEIDAWLKTTPPARQPDAVAEDPPVEVTEPREVTERPRLLTAGRVWGVVGIGLLVAATAIAWRAHRPPVDMAALTIRVTPEAVVAMDSAGAEQWRYSFSPGETTGPLIARRGGPLTVLDDNAGVLVGVDARSRKSDATYLPGELLWLSSSGILRRTFSFSDPVTFGRERYRGWTISDYRVFDQRGRRQIAVSGRHFTWWPSFVTVVDENWKSRGTFFNAGWVEGLHWLSADRLLIAAPAITCATSSKYPTPTNRWWAVA